MQRKGAFAPGLAAPLLARMAFILLCIVGVAYAASGGLHYTGRVLYRANKAPAGGVLVELVEAQEDGQPTDEVLGSTRAEADGRFTIVLAAPTQKNVALVVSAVGNNADTSGDRRQDGYEIKTHRVQLGFLPHPSSTKSNTLLIHPHRPARPSDE